MRDVKRVFIVFRYLYINFYRIIVLFMLLFIVVGAGMKSFFLCCPKTVMLIFILKILFLEQGMVFFCMDYQFK